MKVYTSEEYITILIPEEMSKSYRLSEGWTVRSAYKDFAREQRIRRRPIPYLRLSFTTDQEF